MSNPNDEYVVMPPGQQQNPGDNPQTLMADVMREDRVNNIIQQINPDNLMTEIEHRIRGEKKNTFTGEWEKIIKKDNAIEISDEMVSNFMSYLGSILNQNTSLSFYTPLEINKIMSVVIDYISDDLDTNCEIYGIKGNFSEMNRIGNIICFSVYSVLKRAQNGRESNRVFSSLRVTADVGQPQQRGGALDFLKFW